jgi:hypothetical protein
MKRSTKIVIGIGAVAGLLLLTRSKANANGISIEKGRAYKAAPYFSLYETDSPYKVFATTGSNANFIVHGTLTVTIAGGSKNVALVTYMESYTQSGTYLIDVDAFTQLIK